jgi:gas vesicle protein
MDIHTFEELIDWTQQLHEQLGQSLEQSASNHEQERASLLLDYLAGHEKEIAEMVAEFKDQADPKALKTYVYDHLAEQPISIGKATETPYTAMNFDDICGAVLALHEEVIELYQQLAGRAVIPEAKTLIEGLRDMEIQEVKRLAQQTARMNEL